MFRPVAVAVAASAVLAVFAVPSTAGAQTSDNGVALIKNVYAGADGGAGCASATTFTEAGQNDVVTFCFTVTNTGASHLGQIAINDPHVAEPATLLAADSVPLAPGHSAHYYVVSTPPPDDADGVVDETFTNVASVSALPLDGASQPLAGTAPVTASAEAVVFAPEVPPNAQLRLSTSVYAGHGGGTGCPAADLTLVNEADPITYCYTVTNTGNTHLASIALDQFDIEGTPILIRADSDPLAPDHSAFFFLEANAPALGPDGVIATSSATASSVDASGATLIGVAEISSQDGTEIQALARAATQPLPLPSPAPAAIPEPTPAAEIAVQAEPVSQVTQIEAPEQLAFTGWETWIVAVGGIGLVAGGWALVQESAARRRQAVRLPIPDPAPSRLEDDQVL
ncbi:MAG: hypothetical protein GY773_30945 [Actinomycetia bacterium]|nr:hypothetical protein [Actinomycetes bacterium]MCP5030451.1 hypothetical protein [Actinomycetes bacterium]